MRVALLAVTNAALCAVLTWVYGTANAQDKGTLNPEPLPPLTKPAGPGTLAKELFGRKATPSPAPVRSTGFYSKGWQLRHRRINRRYGMLRARRERPCHRRAAEKCDEFPPPHAAHPNAKHHGRSIAGLGAGQWRASQFKATPLRVARWAIGRGYGA